MNKTNNTPAGRYEFTSMSWGTMFGRPEGSTDTRKDFEFELGDFDHRSPAHIGQIIEVK